MSMIGRNSTTSQDMVWEAEEDTKPVSYPKPEGECLDNYL